MPNPLQLVLLLALTLLQMQPSSSANNPLSSAQKQQLLDVHNRLRMRVANGDLAGQPAASDMALLSWDERLAAKAKNWVNECEVGHDTYDDRKVAGFEVVGQNFAGGTHITNFSHFVQLWYDEHKDFNYASNQCSGVCGHYTQVIWSDTKLVGCAAASGCGKYGNHFVCNYAPGGNWMGQQPYTYRAAGDVESSCYKEQVFVQDGLCVAKQQCRLGSECKCSLEVAGCLNGGSLDREKCKCLCDDGWFGLRCHKKCADKPGYEYTCSLMDREGCQKYTSYCRKSCDLCKDDEEYGERLAVPAIGVVAKVPREL